MTKNIAQRCHGRKPKEEFTGKNLTRFGGTGLTHRFLSKLKLDQHLKAIGTSKRRKEDYSPFEISYSILYALMMGIFRPIHMMELKVDKVFQTGV